jgi:hypothetical protein
MTHLRRRPSRDSPGTSATTRSTRGPLSSARFLEKCAGLMVFLAYGLGLGTDQALKLIRR